MKALNHWLPLTLLSISVLGASCGTIDSDLSAPKPTDLGVEITDLPPECGTA